MKDYFSEKMDEFISEYTPANKVSGYLRVTSKEEIVYERNIGYADMEKKIPFTSDSMFTYYSLSKPFCAIGLMKLKEKGLVDLECHPGKYVPEAVGFDERVTIRQMLQHVSGLPDYNLRDPEDAPVLTIREDLKRLAERPMRAEPGTSFIYATGNYTIAALIIENVSGKSYAEYMKSEVFEPFDMISAKVDNENLVVANRVMGHVLVNDEVKTVMRSIPWTFGGGDIIGKADDVYCLAKAIKNKTMLKPETWEEILTPSSISSMGLGCTVSNWHGKKRITHNGGHVGFRTLHIYLPDDDFDIIFLSNSGWSNSRDEYSEKIYEAFFGRNDNMNNTKVKMDVGYI